MIDTNKKVNFGNIDYRFLSQSVGSLLNGVPLTCKISDSLETVLNILKLNKAGSVVIEDENENIVGIFTERDCVTKLLPKIEDSTLSKSITEFMTKNPTSIKPSDPVSFALNLMSHGGFRNLPVVLDGKILGVISAKDLIDSIVNTFVEDLLEF